MPECQQTHSKRGWEPTSAGIIGYQARGLQLNYESPTIASASDAIRDGGLNANVLSKQRSQAGSIERLPKKDMQMR